MPLRIRLKPEESVRIGDSSVKNVGRRGVVLLIDSPLRVHRDGYMPSNLSLRLAPHNED